MERRLELEGIIKTNMVVGDKATSFTLEPEREGILYYIVGFSPAMGTYVTGTAWEFSRGFAVVESLKVFEHKGGKLIYNYKDKGDVPIPRYKS